ncbi:MAG: trypsin-like peptidase domain-containing protein [Opitutaceae bacterium]
MKFMRFTRLLFFGIAAGTWAFAATRDTPKPRKAPALKVDDTPVTDARSAMVASYADVVEPVQKAVVSVYSKKLVREQLAINPFTGRIVGGGQREEDGLGSGVIVSPDGYILTNNHVVEGADELKVLLADERELIAKVIGADPKTDIAVIKIEAENLPVVTLANSDRLRVGDVVFAVGNPLRVGQTVTMGIVSAKDRNVKILEEVQGYESFIQTDAAINMGNSGGALVDAKGRLIGINSAILSPSRGSIGIGFAVPINLAASIMRSLVETGSVARGYLGVTTSAITPDDALSLGLPRTFRGLVIDEVFVNSPAEKAGLKSGDVVSTMNDKVLTTYEDWRFAIAQMAPGTKVKLKILRKNQEQTIEATLGRLDERPNEILTGVEVATLAPAQRLRATRARDEVDALVITKVDEKSPYADRLSEGMVIIQIDGEEVVDVATARKLLTPGRHSMLLFRNGARRVIIDVK